MSPRGLFSRPRTTPKLLIWLDSSSAWAFWNCRVWLERAANPAILAVMKHRSSMPEQDDLLRPRLVDMIDGRHELVRLAALIDWPWFEREWAGFFPSDEGRPATHPRLVAGLMYLQHAHGSSRRGRARPLGGEPVLPALHR